MLPMGAVSVSSRAPGLRSGSARVIKASPNTDHRTGSERSQVQALVIEQATRLWIGGLQHLKAPIQQVAVLAIRFDAATDPAGGFQHLHRHPPAVQAVGTGQAGDTAADDDDWVFCMCHGRFRMGLVFHDYTNIVWIMHGRK